LELIARLLPIIEFLDPRPEFAPDTFATHYVKLLTEVPDVVPLSSVLNGMLRKTCQSSRFGVWTGMSALIYPKPELCLSSA
jgi:hypothetical protein